MSQKSSIHPAMRVTDMLLSISGVLSAVPVSVQIGTKTYFGAYYEDFTEPTDKSPNPRLDKRYYLLGRLPYSRDHKRIGYIPYARYAFIAPEHHDQLLYYFGYMAHSLIKPENAQYHPLGEWFGLQCYDPDILRSDRTGVPYPTKQITITRLALSAE